MRSSDSRRTHKGKHAQDLPVASEAPARLKLTLALSLLILLVAFTTALVHQPVLSAKALSFDDENAIVRNRLVQNPSLDSVRRFFSEVLLSSVVRGYYRPLTLTSLMLDWAMGARPDNPRVFHRTSLALHIGSTVLVILLCYQIFRRPWIAAAAGLLFGVHPLTVEPIAWVMERKTILAAFFAFAALNAYVRYTRVGTKRWYATALVMFLAALLSKPTATPLPLIMLLMDYWPLNRLNRRSVIEKIPFFALSIAFAVLACVCEKRVNPLTLPVTISPLYLPLRLCWLTMFYPCKVFLPIHLSSVYMLPDPLALTNPIVVAAAAGAVLLIVAVALSARRTPAIWVGAIIFYVGLAPTMGFVEYSWVTASDKYVYMPAVGLLLTLGWMLEQASGGTARLLRGRRAIAAALVLIAATLLAGGTRRQITRWQDSKGLWQYMLSLTPNSPMVARNFGTVLMDEGNFREAEGWFRKAVQLDIRMTDAAARLVISLDAQGKIQEATTFCQEALAACPNDVPLRINCGVCLAHLGRRNEAIEQYRIADRLCPGRADVFENTGDAWAALGNPVEAAKAYRESIRIEDSARVRASLGAVLIQQGQYPAASEQLATALRMDPNCAQAEFNLGVLMVNMGRTGDAERHLVRAGQLAPSLAPTVESAMQAMRVRPAPASAPPGGDHPTSAASQ